MHVATGQRSKGSGALRRIALTLLAMLPLLVAVDASTAAGAGVAAPSSTLTWGKGTALVSARGGVTAVSCPTSTFCVAVDRSGGASDFNGTSWSTPVTIDANNAMLSITCPTTTFCVATDAEGNYVMMNDATWGAPTAFAATGSLEMQAVSCPTTTFCLAVGQTSKFTPVDYYFDNGIWSFDAVAFAPTDNTPFDAVSCPTSTSCVAVDVGGGATTFTLTTGTTPSLTRTGPVEIDPTDRTFSADSVSCVSSTSCVVGSTGNLVSTFTNGIWSTLAPLPQGTRSVLVSCGGSTCVADASNSIAVSAVAPFTSWSTPGALSMLSQINALSCFTLVASIGCEALDNDGFSVAISLGASGVPSLTAAKAFFDPPHDVTSVTCASVTYCIAVDTAGESITYQGGKWGPPQVITTAPLGAREVRCGASAHPYTNLKCAAVVGDFAALELNSYRASWTPVPPASSLTYSLSCSNSCEFLSPEGRSSGLVRGYLPRLPTNAVATDVSCPPGQVECIAIDSAGHSYLSRKGEWYSGPRVEASTKVVLWALSCVSTSFCVAIDLEGHAYTFNGVKWSAPDKISPLGLYSLSCGATYFCVAGNLLGGAYVFDGSHWLTTANLASGGSLHSVSCASASTCVGVDSDSAFALNVPTASTTIDFVAATTAEKVVGRTIVAVTVSSTTAPSGNVILSAGTAPGAPSCTATLRRISRTSASAHCTVATRHVGPTSIDASFEGSFGFAPSGPRAETLNLVTRR